ncbi:RRXRR domain-containing protein, partial [Erysipelotrichaceae bacterium RD49]|nr:RRXRR domain-containing protein [Erysipelotrichaceae bacterium RD49]
EPGTHVVQPVTLGVDAGSKHIGLSACTNTKELYAEDAQLRTDVSKKLTARREARRTRRNRKTRYRKPRFNNRVHSKHKGWLVPSVEQKITCHLNVIRKVAKILPVSKIVIETASFDTQKLKAQLAKGKLPEGKDYQNGEMKDWFNVRDYVLFRDRYICQCCKGKSKDKELQVHPIHQRKDGGSNRPENLVTLCKHCHQEYHKGNIELPSRILKPASFADANFMGVRRKTLLKRAQAEFDSIPVEETFGYLTKTECIKRGLDKEYYIDARCISGHPEARAVQTVFFSRKVRCHNRQIHKFNPSKGGTRKLNQSAKVVKGFRLFDKIRYQKMECFIFGKRTSGSFNIRMFDGTTVSASVSWKKLRRLESSNGWLIDKQKAAV